MTCKSWFIWLFLGCFWSANQVTAASLIDIGETGDQFFMTSQLNVATVENGAPGAVLVREELKVVNRSSYPMKVSLSLAEADNVDELFTIGFQQGTSHQTEVSELLLEPYKSEQYTVTIAFDHSAGNQYQNQTTHFWWSLTAQQQGGEPSQSKLPDTFEKGNTMLGVSGMVLIMWSWIGLFKKSVKRD